MKYKIQTYLYLKGYFRTQVHSSDSNFLIFSTVSSLLILYLKCWLWKCTYQNMSSSFVRCKAVSRSRAAETESARCFAPMITAGTAYRSQQCWLTEPVPQDTSPVSTDLPAAPAGLSSGVRLIGKTLSPSIYGVPFGKLKIIATFCDN